MADSTDEERWKKRATVRNVAAYRCHHCRRDIREHSASTQQCVFAPTTFAPMSEADFLRLFLEGHDETWRRPAGR